MSSSISAPHTIWLTGLSGAGKSTLAQALKQALQAEGAQSVLLDGDTLRAGLCRDLGFDETQRRENIRRAAEVARLLNDNGMIVVAAMITPLAADRALARQIVSPHPFFEVHVATPLAVCEARDPKGLYQRARAGQLPSFTGVSAPYEAPLQPQLRIDTSRCSLDEAVSALRALSR
jgi:adenylylsulfate kinase